MMPFVTLGPVHLSTYVLLHVLAFATGLPLALHRLLRGGYPVRWIAEGLGGTLVAGIVGAAGVGAVLAHVPGAWALPVRSGSTIFGALVAGGLTGLAYCRFRGSPPGRPFELALLPLPLGQAIGRLGCLAAGCCGGRPTDSWLAIAAPGNDGVWLPRYPTQLMAAGCDLLIFLALVGFERFRRVVGRPDDWPFPGFLVVLYGELYFGKRFVLQFLREDPPVRFGPFSWAHGAAAFGLLLATVLLAWNLYRVRHEPVPGAG
jgi:phosphatidylglycerol:prolipoprotein diacylglycerol transferase